MRGSKMISPMRRLVVEDNDDSGGKSRQCDAV